MAKQKYICLVAGRSGGHIVPAMTFGHDFLHKNLDYQIVFFSTHTKLDKALVKLYPFISHSISLTLENFPGKNILKYPLFIFQLVTAYLKSLAVLRQYRPDYVLSMGGYISIPVCLAARTLRIPVELFELNATPGRATSFLARFARKIHVCFSHAKRFFNPKKVIFTPYPLRFSESDKVSKAHACVQLGLDPAKKILLVLGGSQGSRFINNLLSQFVQKYAHELKQVQIVHQTGSTDSELIEKEYFNHAISVQVFDYKSDLQLFYCAADLVIARAGAGTLFELAFFEKNSIIIPLETSITAHQLDNARVISHEKPNLFTVIRQLDIEKDIDKFFEKIKAEVR